MQRVPPCFGPVRGDEGQEVGERQADAGGDQISQDAADRVQYGLERVHCESSDVSCRDSVIRSARSRSRLR